LCEPGGDRTVLQVLSGTDAEELPQREGPEPPIRTDRIELVMFTGLP